MVCSYGLLLWSVPMVCSCGLFLWSVPVVCSCVQAGPDSMACSCVEAGPDSMVCSCVPDTGRPRLGQRGLFTSLTSQVQCWSAVRSYSSDSLAQPRLCRAVVYRMSIVSIQVQCRPAVQRGLFTSPTSQVQCRPAVHDSYQPFLCGSAPP
jgi:hypothetical protein